MKICKWFVAFGMIGVISFFIHVILGDILHVGYNPIQQSISELTADGAPFFRLLRIFVIIYEISLLIYLLGMVVKSFYKHHGWVKSGFVLMLLTAIFSIIGFNTFPMTVRYIVSLKNTMHTIVTIILLFSSILAVLFISIGYFTQEKLIKLGWFTFLCAVISSIFNVLMWYAVSQGGEYFGIIERLTIYPFHIFVFVISWYYFQLSRHHA